MKKGKKIKTFRDLGGISCKDSRTIVFGKLMRSGHHGNLKSVQELWLKKKYDIKNIVDLRADEEVAYKPDKIISAISYSHIPLLTDEQNPVINKHTANSNLKKIIKEGGASKHLKDVYKLFIDSDLSTNGLRQIFDILLYKEEGTLWHCTQGKDRTGITSAAVLMSLGCERDVIIEDYMSYNKICRIKNFFIYIGMTIITFSRKKASNLIKLLSARREFIESSFKEIDEKYGNDLNFLLNGVGLTQEEILKMQELYLE